MPARVPSPISRRQTVRFVAISATGLLLSACTTVSSRPSGEHTATQTPPEGANFASRFAGFEVADEPNGDLDKVDWPEWLSQFDPEIKRLYEFQIRNGDLMRWMPCFCGCGQSSGHRNNRDCYVRAVHPDGSVAFDPMAPT